jgi:2-dehydro-3-deoxyphosphogluconate aldolase/(4S)-4-hydroxy-2-oxoglutarate aldolase
MPEATVFESSRLLGIVRFQDGGDVAGAIEALLQGGIELVEITIDTPGALAAVERAAGEGRTVGVGTVVTAEQVRACAAAGARFVVSPGVIAEVIDHARSEQLEAVAGVFTATEILTATAAGSRVLKLFPASTGGPAYLRALRGPFPTTPLVPTGGVHIEQIAAYFDAGATAVALGGELVGRAAPRTDAELERITAQARRANEAAREAVVPATAG